jgi:hypothetical protein
MVWRLVCTKCSNTLTTSGLSDLSDYEYCRHQYGWTTLFRRRVSYLCTPSVLSMERENTILIWNLEEIRESQISCIIPTVQTYVPKQTTLSSVINTPKNTWYPMFLICSRTNRTLIVEPKDSVSSGVSSRPLLFLPPSETRDEKKKTIRLGEGEKWKN